MSVKIGNIEIPRKYGPNVFPYIGGVLFKVSILGDQPILHKLHTLKKEDVYEMESLEINCIVQIKDIKIRQEEIGNKVIHHFNIDFKRI